MPYGAPRSRREVRTVRRRPHQCGNCPSVCVPTGDIVGAQRGVCRGGRLRRSSRSAVLLGERSLGRDNHSDKYQRKVFGLREHRKLAERLRTLADRGVDFVLTNSAEPEMVRLYEQSGLRVETIQMPRAINSKVDQRSGVAELVVTPGNAAESHQESAVLSIFGHDPGAHPTIHLLRVRAEPRLLSSSVGR